MADESGELNMVVVHASAALRRKADTLASLRRDVQRSDPLARERVVGDASEAAISFYLAASAAQRYCAANDEPGPLGRRRLGEVVESARHLRDTVMHWEDKGSREPETSLFVDGRGLVIYAPPGPKAGTIAKADGFMWRDFERFASSLERWARYLLRETPEAPE